MADVIEISSGEEEVIVSPSKKSKIKEESDVSFTVKTITGDGHCIINCFSSFFKKESSEVLNLLWNEFQIHLDTYMQFGEYKSTAELLKSLENYIFNKVYNSDTVDLVLEALSKIFKHRVFIFQDSLSSAPLGVIGEKYNRCINLLKTGEHYNLVLTSKEEKGNER